MGCRPVSHTYHHWSSVATYVHSTSRAAHCSHATPSRMRHLIFLLLHRAHAWMYDGSLVGITAGLPVSSGLPPAPAPDCRKAGAVEKGMPTARCCCLAEAPPLLEPRSAGCSGLVRIQRAWRVPAIHVGRQKSVHDMSHSRQSHPSLLPVALQLIEGTARIVHGLGDQQTSLRDMERHATREHVKFFRSVAKWL